MKADFMIDVADFLEERLSKVLFAQREENEEYRRLSVEYEALLNTQCDEASKTIIVKWGKFTMVEFISWHIRGAREAIPTVFSFEDFYDYRQESLKKHIFHNAFERSTQRLHNFFISLHYQQKNKKRGKFMKNKLLSMVLLMFLFSATACSGNITTDEEIPSIENPSVQSDMQKEAETKNQTLSSKNNSNKSLTISVCWEHYNIDEAVKRFKQIHPDVEITVNSYGNDDAKYKTQVVTNLMAGTSDDILDGTGLPYIKLVDSGLLAGFYPLMENDPDFNRNDYYTNVFTALDYKRQMYVFPINFAYSLTGVNNTMGGELVAKYSQYKTVTDSDLLSLYNETQNKNGFYIEENFNPLNVIANNLDQFIDYENKKCNFNSDEFIDLVTDAKNATESDKIERQNSYGLGLGQDALNAKKYLFKDTTIGGYGYFLPYKELNSFTHFIPKANQKGELYIYPTMRFCISEKSKNKELAWEFLKFLTLPETNELISFGNMFSVNKETFKAKTTSALEQFVKDMESQNNIFLEGDTQEHIENAIAYFDQYNQLPMHSTTMETYLEIIMNDTKMLDKGLMTPEQLASDLQNKISLSLME